ncbi:MAG: M24 family metallopeptidase, partial [Myxococcota bacterium]
MPLERLSARQAGAMRAAGEVAAATLARVGAALRPGRSAADVDRLVREDTAARGARPAQLGYPGFPGAVCVSVNDVACHGIPRPDVVFASGDLVSIDVTSELEGWHGDTCATFGVGSLGP